MTTSSETICLRVQQVRFQGEQGVVLAGLALDESRSVRPDAPRYAVSVPGSVLPARAEEGQWWNVSGTYEDVEYDAGGWRVRERRMRAQSAELLRPSGEHIVQLLARSAAFPGIGEVKARKLWESLGESLYDALDEADQSRLAAVVGHDLAHVLVQGWRSYGDADSVRAFQRMGLNLSVSQKLLLAYGDEALDHVEQDPYRLLAFGMTWRAVDWVASQHFGLDANDFRRLGAAVEAALFKRLDQGHTCATCAEVNELVEGFVGKDGAPEALRHADAARHVIQRGTTLFGLGTWAMEQAVARRVALMSGARSELLSDDDVAALIRELERAEGAAIPGFALNAAQSEAVRLAAVHPLLLITGGAGVGKTTVLKAICSMLEKAGQEIYLMALSGRAAKRMAEATNRKTMTIAGFLRNVAKEPLPANCTIVVDEASMLDLLLAYRLVGVLPEEGRLILIGDPSQLPPVGPGLTLHALADIAEVPKVELTVVKRFGGTIASTALAVRSGALPSLPSEPSAEVAFIECEAEDLAAKTLELYLVDPANTQVLTFTREKGPASSASVNAVCQEVLAESAKKLLLFNDERGRLEDCGLRVGEPVLCTKNLWDIGVQNGSLGRLHAIEEPPLVDLEGTVTYGWIRWDDGELRPLTFEVLDAIELGYAVTVHKAQGSQFQRVIVPVSKTRNLDRTMLYTAITRATNQVLMVGDRAAASKAARELPHSSHRRVGLRDLVIDALAAL
ncbi:MULTISPECIES: AAA family ATPase [Ramlibacter]|uniref:AAA family ATPase n=1 Tax=Ramlibacter pinisoli TaxID=2682844 RepID=A0A6N8ISE6_9BURK|nr:MULTISPECIES: AAA family ATPase [Ramlibacter]MBA2964687.1 AAA family ATPase [Ramlibacter sp. CGMCC 1.13660]MVQ29652.1 AAA family ATPase [Ramlibacter pinisoli]